MQYQKILIDEASTKQLRDFAQSHLGITIPGNTKPENVLTKVTEAWPQKHIMVPVEKAQAQPTAKGTAPQPVTDEQQPPQREMVRVHITSTEEKGGNEPVPVGVNGKVMLVPRGQNVDIPIEYYLVLENAVMDRYDTDEEGHIIPVPRKVKAYPVQRVA